MSPDHNATITLLRAVKGGKVDDYGNPVPDYETIEVTGVLADVAGGGTTEQDHGPVVRGSVTFYLPQGTEVTPLDRIVFDGDQYKPDGYPQHWRVPASFHHLTARTVVTATRDTSKQGVKR